MHSMIKRLSRRTAVERKKKLKVERLKVLKKQTE